VPEYARGELYFETEEFFQSRLEGGHQPWRGVPRYVVEYLCDNLLGDRLQSLRGWPEGYIETSERSESAAGLVVQQLDIRTIEVTVPDLGKYMFTARHIDDFGLAYIKTIIFAPA
jgi:hypothetical protein